MSFTSAPNAQTGSEDPAQTASAIMRQGSLQFPCRPLAIDWFYRHPYRALADHTIPLHKPSGVRRRELASAGIPAAGRVNRSPIAILADAGESAACPFLCP